MSKESKKTINKKDNTKLINTLIIIGIVFLIASLVLMFTDKKRNFIKAINYQEYTDILKEDKYNIILLTSPTCGHCTNYKPYVNYVASENDLTVYDIDISSLEYDEYLAIHDKYSVLANEVSGNDPVIPTPVTIIVKNGVEVASVLGNIGQSGFTSLLKNNNIIK